MDAAESKVRVRKREHCVFESRTNLYSGASHSLTESENFRNASVVSVLGLRQRHDDATTETAELRHKDTLTYIVGSPKHAALADVDGIAQHNW